MANDYSFGNAQLQPAVGSMTSWGKPSGFNLDPSSSSFGEYGLLDGKAGNFSLGGGGVGSSFGQPLGPAGGGGGSSGGIFGNLLDSRGADGTMTQGWGGLALGAASSLFNGWMAMKQYGLAKDTLKHNKHMFAKNFDAQKRTTNASLEDRQRGRVASNAGAYESVGSYMDKNGIK